MKRAIKRPMDAKDVEEALRTSSKERRLWTKQGYLPVSGEVFFKTGENARVPHYHPSKIAVRALDPELIAEWRQKL